MKKVGIGFCVGAVAAVLAIVSLIVFEVSVSTAQGYFDMSHHGMTIALFVFGAVFIAASALLSFLKPAKVLVCAKTVLIVAGCMCLGYVIGEIVFAIATEFAYTYASNFNVGTAKENFIPNALTQSIVSIVLTALAMIVAAVSGAFGKSSD